MSSPINNLNDVLKNLTLPKEIPHTLPITHLSTAKKFDSIADEGGLIPTTCNVFNEDLTYLFYGGIFYRTSYLPTRDATECPVAFVFCPSILKDIFKIFPFDTGALAHGRFGKWTSELINWDKYQILGNGDHTLLSRIVHFIFGTNQNYLKGIPDPNCSTLPEPFPVLYNFYNDDLSPDVDKRQFMIECQGNNKILFNEKLLWVGFPDSFTSVFNKILINIDPYVPDFFEYEASSINHPSDIAAVLEYQAKKSVIERFLNPGRR